MSTQAKLQLTLFEQLKTTLEDAPELRFPVSVCESNGVAPTRRGYLLSSTRLRTQRRRSASTSWGSALYQERF